MVLNEEAVVAYYNDAAEQTSMNTLLCIQPPVKSSKSNGRISVATIFSILRHPRPSINRACRPKRSGLRR